MINKTHGKKLHQTTPYGKGKLSSRVFVLVLVNYPTKTLYLLETVFSLASFRTWVHISYSNVLWHIQFNS